MMSTEHPITPPPELVQQWYDNIGSDPEPFESFAIAAARWGADQELEACCEWVGGISGKYGPRLRIARRPKPTLKQQALSELDSLENMGACNADTIRRALEALPDE